MSYEAISRALDNPSEENVVSMLNESNFIFWVDWREEDTAIVKYCENILKTGSLRSDVINTDNNTGFAMFLSYKYRKQEVPLVVGPEDRHITLVSLNQILAQEYEIRLCTDSYGSDTLAFCVLPIEKWIELETLYGSMVSKLFSVIAEKPNVFTDPLPLKRTHGNEIDVISEKKDKNWKFSSEAKEIIPLPPKYKFPQALNYLNQKSNSFYILENENGFIQCAGSKEKCTIELREYIESGGFRHFVFFNSDGSEGKENISMSSGEIERRGKHCFGFLTAAKLFSCFYESKDWPDGIELEDITYQFK